MKAFLMTCVLSLSPVALAHELDNERTVSAEQIALAKDLPATTVVRISESDPNNIEVAVTKEPLKRGEKVDNLKFEKVAMNAEVSGLAFNSGNELDATSSTSSWVVAVGRPGYPGYRYPAARPYGYRGYGYGYGAGYGYGYGGGYPPAGGGYPYGGGYNNWYYDQAVNSGAEYYPGAYGEPRWNSYNGGVGSSEYQKNGCLTNYSCPEAFYPSYQYSGYQYNYAPYYTYSQGGYNYAYTGWGY